MAKYKDPQQLFDTRRSAWKTAVIASAGETSGEVDLGDSYGYLMVNIPTITSATLSITVAMESGGTFVDLDSASYVAGTGALGTTFLLGGWQFIKIVSSATQGAERTFYVRGVEL